MKYKISINFEKEEVISINLPRSQASKNAHDNQHKEILDHVEVNDRWGK